MRTFNFILAAAVIVALTAGCDFLRGAKGPTCQVVDVLHQACTLVKFEAADGTVHEVQVPASELAALGAQKAGLKAAMAPDAGCPQ